MNAQLELDDALDELKQIFGVDPVWMQHQQDAEAKRLRRQKRGTKPRSLEPAVGAPPKDPRSATGSKSSGKENKPSVEPSSPKKQQPKPKSCIESIIEHNPAKNSANQELAKEFVELGGYELTHGDKQKGISRMNVAKQLRNTPEPVKSGAQARKIRGIGPSSAAKVDEVLHHGKMHALEKYESGDEQEAQEI